MGAGVLTRIRQQTGRATAKIQCFKPECVKWRSIVSRSPPHVSKEVDLLQQQLRVLLSSQPLGGLPLPNHLDREAAIVAASSTEGDVYVSPHIRGRWLGNGSCCGRWPDHPQAGAQQFAAKSIDMAGKHNDECPSNDHYRNAATAQ